MKASIRSVFILFPVVLFLTFTLLFFPTTTRADTQALTRIQSFDNLPPGLAAVMANAMQRELPEDYYMCKAGSEYNARSQAHEMEFTFTPAGPRVKSADGAWRWGMNLKRWGYAGNLEEVSAARLHGEKGRFQ